jgi:hypothetical protein
MEELLAKIYFDPATGFQGLKKLYTKAKEVNPAISIADVKNFLQNNTTDQIHRKVANKESGVQILGGVGHFQLDLTFLSQYKNQNRGFHIILVCVEVNTKKAYARALKNKTQNVLATSIQEILLQMKKDKQSFTVFPN